MFEYLRRWEQILVSGPQRSGTRIVAKAAAQDLGYRYVDEGEIGTQNEAKLRRLLAGERRVVVQCPALCHRLHELGGDDVAIVVVRRCVEDIVASEKRIGWSPWAELRKYGLGQGVIAQVKYDYWQGHQRPLIAHAFEVEYESLAGHPLWVPREKRGDFRWNQTASTS